MNTKVPLMFHANFNQIYLLVLKKKFILLFLLVLVSVAILDSRPDPVYNSETMQSDHVSTEIWQILV